MWTACAGGTSSAPEPTSRCWPRVRVRRLPARWSAPKAGELEEVMLQVRLAHGIPADVYPPQRTARLRDTGLLEDADGARLRLTRKGRMLADAVVRVLLGWD